VEKHLWDADVNPQVVLHLLQISEWSIYVGIPQVCISFWRSYHPTSCKILFWFHHI